MIFSEQKKGFTAPELLVAVALFTLVGGIAIDFFISTLSFQRESKSTEALVDRLSFATEKMSRALRGAQKELGSGCLSTYGLNYEIIPGSNGSGIQFVDPEQSCRKFFLEDGQIKEQVDGGASAPLSPQEISIEDMRFSLLGEAQEDLLQPRVSFSIQAKPKGTKLEFQQVIQLHTTVSQRRFDVIE